MESRVGELDLRVTAPLGSGASVRSDAETFARDVLARCDELLSARAPRRVLLVRHLETRWRLRADMLRSRSEIDAVATELARHLDDEARTSRYPPGPGAEVVSFEDEDTWRAAFASAAAAGRARAWYFAPLAAHSPADRVEGRVGRLPATMRDGERTARATDPAARAEPPAEGVEDPAAAVDAVAAGASGPAPEKASDGTDEALASFETAVDARRSTEESAYTGTPLEPRGTGSAPEQAATGSIRSVETSREPEADRGVAEAPQRTRFGGLFFLLNPILELSLAEMLWTMGLPEGAVLARVAAALLGAAGPSDPGPRLLGGCEPPAALPPLSDEVLCDAAEKMLAALVEALPRRALGRTPALDVGTVIAPCGRLLVATIAGTELPVLVRAAASSAALEDGLHLLARLWPREAPVRAAPGLAAFAPAWIRSDPRVRVRSSTLRHVDGDAGATALASQLAGTLGAVVAARTGSIVEDGHLTWDGLVAARLAVPAVVRAATEALVVAFDAERVDLAVRRAGLDRDPGWVPWLAAEVRFEFEAGEP